MQSTLFLLFAINRCGWQAGDTHVGVPEFVEQFEFKFQYGRGAEWLDSRDPINEYDLHTRLLKRWERVGDRFGHQSIALYHSSTESRPEWLLGDHHMGVNTHEQLYGDWTRGFEDGNEWFGWNRPDRLPEHLHNFLSDGWRRG